MRLRTAAAVIAALATAAATVPLLAAAASAAPPAAPSVTPVTSVDLSTYTRVGRYDLPEPTRTAAPPDSLLAQEVSSVTYDPDTDTLFVVGDGGTSVVQVTKTGQLIDSMTLAPGDSPAGTTFYDTEGISYVGSGQFVITEERYRQVDLFTYVPGGTLTRADVQSVKLGTTLGNIGLEGVAHDPQSGGYLLVKEMDPEGIFQTGIDFAAGTATNGSPTTQNSTNLFDPALIGIRDLSDVFAMSNLPTLAAAEKGNLLVISQESGQVVEVDRAGTVQSRLILVGDPGNPLSIPEQTNEGVTMDADGNLYVVNEQGGGDVDHPQLWVYAHSDAADQAPSAVTVTPGSATIPDSTSTDARVRLADVRVADSADGGIGTNTLAVTGPDAAAFDVDSTGLYLAAGTVLDATRQPSYDVAVTVDDPAAGAAPDASAPFHLDVAPTGGAASPSSVYLSEVSPTSSSAGSYAADWFELSNAGNVPVDLTGWSMNDDTNTAGGAALAGVAALPVGGSVVFVEGDAATAAAFAQAWFGSTPPAGLQVGWYAGSGVGLSSGGDALAVFDAAGNRVTGVSFAATAPGATLDNSVGVGGAQDGTGLPPIAAPSVAGANGAVTDADGETGSPGATGPHAVITEAAPWASGDAPYGADWFEVTNTGDLPLDLSGWSMDDDSATASTSVPLRGVASLSAGESAVFIQGQPDGSTDAELAAAFATAWFGTATPPPGRQIGSYGGSGVGLSTGGDAVTLFDGTGSLATAIDFGPSTSGQTFDNGAGLGGPALPPATVWSLSVAGAAGAFTATDGTEIGSPFTTTAVAVTTPPVTTPPATTAPATTAPAPAVTTAPAATTPAPPKSARSLANTGASQVGLSLSIAGLLLAAGLMMVGLTSARAQRKH